MTKTNQPVPKGKQSHDLQLWEDESGRIWHKCTKCDYIHKGKITWCKSTQIKSNLPKPTQPLKPVSKKSPPTGQEEWEMEFEKFYIFITNPKNYGVVKYNRDSIARPIWNGVMYPTIGNATKDFIRQQTDKAEARGFERAIEEVVKLIQSEYSCIGPNDEIHRCSAGHCDHCGECDVLSELWNKLYELSVSLKDK